MVTAGEDPSGRELLGWLAAKRHHVAEQLTAVPETERHHSVVPSGWTPAGLVQHLALDVERFWFRCVLAGEPVELPQGHEGWEVTDGTTGAAVLALYREECRLADAVLAALDLDAAPRWWPDGDGACPHGTVREVLAHVLVETATHAGHLDVARERVDGGQRLVLDRP